MSKKGLKRGLEHLFEDNNHIDSEEVEVKILQIDDITPNPYQPRKIFDKEKMDELAQSIIINGIFQPILVRKNIIGYEIISGERRLKASKIAELTEIPCIVYDYDDTQMMEIAILENIQREDLSIVEEGNSYKKLIENLDYTQEKLAKRLGISRSHISNLIRVTKLEKNILSSLEKNEISLGHAKILIGIENEENRLNLFHQILLEKLNVRQTEKAIKFSENHNESKVKRKVSNKSRFSKIEEIMIEKLSTKVEISGDNKGQIKINYESEEDLQRLIELLSILEE